jgi:hypothetical protein
VTILAAATLTACAAPLPMVVTQDFTELAAHKAFVAPDCAVAVTEVRDDRLAPEVLGVVSGRAIKGPADPVDWLRKALGNLTSRGVTPSFPAAANGDGLQARVALRKAWLTNTHTNMTANVVMHVQADRAGMALLERDYRGYESVINWNSSDSELQTLVVHAFGKAMDAMAVDFTRVCREQSTPKP